MTNGTAPTRAYRSALRSEQAATTRLRVIDAAADLFASKGYARTTLAAIAAAAGVSVETVQAQGPKRDLLGASVRRGSLGREGDEPLLAAPEARAVAEASTRDEFTRAAAALMAGFNSRTSGIWRAFASAAADDPAIDAEWAAVMALIRQNVSDVVGLVGSRGWLRADVDHDELVAGIWIVVGAETYEKLTDRLGWPVDRYRTWLARSIAEVLFSAG